MSPRRRLLFLSPFSPRLDAGHGGARATAHLLAALAERHDAALLHFRAPGEPPADDALHARCAFVEEVPRSGDHGPLLRRAARGARLLAAPLRGVPIWAEAFQDPAFAGRLRERVGGWRPEIVQGEFHVMGPYLRALGAAPRPRTVLVEHEPGVPAAAERFREAAPLAKPWYRLDLAAWRRFEPGVLRAADAVVAFTDRDRAALEALAPAASVRVIPLAVPAPPSALTNGVGSPKGEATVLFVGNFAHPPNRAAAERLLDAIFPAVRARCPRARLLLVGPQPDRRIEEAAGDGVEVLGAVQSVAPYLAAADVVVAPLFTGGGMRLKVLEALAAGKALVASPLAVSGLDVTAGEHVILADDDAAFAARIVALLRDAPAREALAARAHAWAARNVSVDRMVRDYEALYEALLQDR